MTTSQTHLAPKPFHLPDIPQREPDEVTQFDQLFKTGRSHTLAIHLGNPETTLVEADRWITATPGSYRNLAFYPDLMIAFDARLDLYAASNGYIISEQGKPPDFVLEIASPSTARRDTDTKRTGYAALGIPEYWRFDETGEHHGARLAGDRLVNNAYQPIPIEQPEDGVLQGYSAALNLNLRWEQGQLQWHDPATGRPLPTYEDQRIRADNAEARVRELERRLRQQAP